MAATHHRTWVYGVIVGATVILGYCMTHKGSDTTDVKAAATGDAAVAGDPAPSGDAAAAARRRLVDAMIEPRFCFQESFDYAVRDADFLDAVLAKLLGQATLAEVAHDEREMKTLVREAPAMYAAQLQTADGLLRLEKVVAQRFAQPTVRVNGKLVEVDYGHIAAKLHVNRRNAIGIDFDASPHLVNREWRSSEVAAALQQYLDKYPQADGVQLRVVIPEALLATEWQYSYRRSTDRVLITFPGAPRRPFLSTELHRDFAPYISGQKSLATKDLPSINPSIMQPVGGSEPPDRE